MFFLTPDPPCRLNFCELVIKLIRTLSKQTPHLLERKRLDVNVINGLEPGEYPDELKYAFASWIPHVGLLFHQVKELDEQDVLGPNFLKVAVS